MRILCVEDEKPLREDIAEYLRLQSHQVDEAGSGQEALDQVARGEYDVVLCDIKMPQMDGFDVLRHIRADQKSVTTPFIFLSALTEHHDRLRAHQGGCDAYLTKPINFSVLDATLTAHLTRKRANDILFNQPQEPLRSHVIATIEDSLRQPMTDVSLLMQHLREAASTMARDMLDGHLQEVQQKINDHAAQLDTLRRSLVLQQQPHAPAKSTIRATELLEKIFSHEAVEKAVIQVDGVGISVPESITIHGHIMRLRHALEGLVRHAQPQAALPILLRCYREENSCRVTVADHPGLLDDGASEFIIVDEATDLASLSPITRARLVPLLYASEVARLHGGSLEIKLEGQALAASLLLPQAPL